MKNMTMLLILLMPCLLLAQNKNESNTSAMSREAEFWMDKISSDSEMRVKMMNMIIGKTADNKEEMLKLVDAVLNNTEMREMIISENNIKMRNENISAEPRGTTNGTVKKKEMTGTKIVPRKK